MARSQRETLLPSDSRRSTKREAIRLGVHDVGESSEPLVTVVTPSYNYGRFLGQCLASVRSQSYPHIEHVVLDARSTDNSAEVIASFEGTYRMRSIIARDAGQADALNRGFAQAQGSIYCWLNADDYWLHEHVVEEAVQELSRGSDVVTGGGRHVDANACFLSSIRPPYQLLRELRYDDPDSSAGNVLATRRASLSSGGSALRV